MLGNFISLLGLIALVGLMGWLTFRASRAKRWLIKWPGLLSSSLLTVMLAIITFIAVRGLAFMYFPPAPLPGITVEGTPEQIARGRYLVSVACVGCHGAEAGTQLPLSGGTDMSEDIAIPIGEDIAIPIGKIVVHNLTPGGVLAQRTDAELFRAIRYGYGKGKRAAFMTFMSYRQLSDEDTKAIIAFLRSQEPVTTEVEGGDDINILGAILLFGARLQPLPETTDGPITAPPMGTTPEYGKYVATFGECRGCHGPDMAGAEATLFAPAFPNPRPLVATLTAEQFIDRMRTGRRPDGSELQMPWKNAAAMSDDDLAALYSYLTAPLN